MSMCEWPIVMFGVNLNDLDMKHEPCLEELIINANKNIENEMQEKFFSWSSVDDDFYIGICPRYPWDKKIPYETEVEAKNAIADFLEKFTNSLRREILDNIGEIEAVGWNN